MKLEEIIEKISDFISWVKLLPIKKSLRQGYDFRKTVISSVKLGMFSDGQESRKIQEYKKNYYSKANYNKEQNRSLLNEWVSKYIDIDSFRHGGDSNGWVRGSEYYSDKAIDKYSKYPHKIKLVAFHESDKSPYILIFVECVVQTRFRKSTLFSTFRIDESDKLTIIRDRRREKSLTELL